MQDELSKGSGKLQVGKDSFDITPEMVSITKETKRVGGRHVPTPASVACGC